MKDKWTTDSMPDQTGRIALVTGANSGIGFECARALAAKNAEVILVCRNAIRGQIALDKIKEEHPEANLHLELMDLASLQSVNDAAARIRAAFKKIDIVILNAGVMVPPFTQTEDGFELQFGANHLGHFAFMAHLLDAVANTPGARIVSETSVASFYGQIDFDDPNSKSKPYKKWQSYYQSKLANLMFALELNERLRRSGAEVIAIAAHPGYTRTNLQQHSLMAKLMNPLFGMPQPQGALPTLLAATDPNAQAGVLYGPHGFMQLRGHPQVCEYTTKSNRRDLEPDHRKRLWEMSEKMTGVTFLSDDTEKA